MKNTFEEQKKRQRGMPYRRRQLTAEEAQQKQLGHLYDFASFMPVSGEIISAKEAKEHYDQGNYGMMALAGIGAIPLVGTLARPLIKGTGKVVNASGVGGLLNKTAQNTPTLIEDFYTRPVKGKVNFVKEYAKAVPTTIRESIDPVEVARRREFGISKVKAEEGLMGKVGKDSEYTAISMNTQIPQQGVDNALERSVVGLSYLDRGIPIDEVDRIKSGIGTGFRMEGAEAIPESIINRATNHLTRGSHVKNRDSIDYEFQIKDPSTKGGDGYKEAVGSGKSAGAMVIRSLRGSANQKYLARLNKITGSDKTKLIGRDMVEFMQISSTLDADVIRKLKSRGVKGQPNEILNDLLAARLKIQAGQEVKGAQKKIVEEFDKLLRTRQIKLSAVKDEAGNVVSNANINNIREPDGYLVTQQAYNSRQKELGGVNAFVAVDPETEKMYAMLSDGHDIMGMNPVGGKGLITAQPIIVSSIKQGAKYSNKQVATRLTPEEILKSEKALEKITGVTKAKNESSTNYALRALATGKPPVTKADIKRANMAKAKLGVTIAGAGLLTKEMLDDD